MWLCFPNPAMISVRGNAFSASWMAWRKRAEGLSVLTGGFWASSIATITGVCHFSAGIVSSRERRSRVGMLWKQFFRPNSKPNAPICPIFWIQFSPNRVRIFNQFSFGADTAKAQARNTFCKAWKRWVSNILIIRGYCCSFEHTASLFKIELFPARSTLDDSRIPSGGISLSAS